MDLLEVVDDLIVLQQLADSEVDEARRQSMEAVRSRLGRRERGARVLHAARVLELPVPAVRSLVEGGVLQPVPGESPVPVKVLSLADVKRALDLIRLHADDRQLLAEVMRVLRDRAALAGSEDGFADLAAGRVVPLGDDLLDELRSIRNRTGYDD